jgi:hypothetical protein
MIYSIYKSDIPITFPGRLRFTIGAMPRDDRMIERSSALQYCGIIINRVVDLQKVKLSSTLYVYRVQHQQDNLPTNEIIIRLLCIGSHAHVGYQQTLRCPSMSTSDYHD